MKTRTTPRDRLPKVTLPPFQYLALLRMKYGKPTPFVPLRQNILPRRS